MADMGCTANVEAFHGNLGKLESIPIGTCYTAIDHLVLQETIIRVFHQCLYHFGGQMEESLINPNQLWANMLVINTCPKQYSNEKSLHGIYHGEITCTFHSSCMGAQATFLHDYQVTRRLLIVDRLFHIQTGMGPIFADLCSA